MVLKVPQEPIRTQLDRALADGCTPGVATDKVLAPYGPTSPLVVFVRQVVLSEAWRLQRRRDRTTEDLALVLVPARPVVAGQPVVAPRLSVARLRAKASLPDVQFALADGSKVAWGRATVDQHQLRIAWLRRHLDAVGVSLDRHSAAVALIERHGVSCLDEIPGWVDELGVVPADPLAA